jgi:DNA-binding CsgD family transcriptional regulator
MNGHGNRQMKQSIIPGSSREEYSGQIIVAAIEDAPSRTPRSSEGFLLLSSAMVPSFINRAAAEILFYPQKPEDFGEHFQEVLAKRVRDVLLSKGSSKMSALVTEFSSGRRVYRCRSYRIGAIDQGDSQAGFAAIFERGASGTFAVSQVSERFHLTIREREVMQYLLSGLTTKEIATGMAISPNTVKAFLRMIMVKMGVSTRSAIVGKAFMAS